MPVMLAVWGVLIDWAIVYGAFLLFHTIGYLLIKVSPLDLESRPRFYRSAVGSLVLWLSVFALGFVNLLGTEYWLTAATGGPRPYLHPGATMFAVVASALAATAAVAAVQWYACTERSNQGQSDGASEKS
jgi:hypothetical protein